MRMKEPLQRLSLTALWQVVDVLTKEPLPVGEEGELLFKGPQVAAG